MHGYVDITEFLADVSGFLVAYYAALAVMNAVAGWTAHGVERRTTLLRFWRLRLTTSAVWWTLAVIFSGMAWIAYQADPAWLRWISVPETCKTVLNYVVRPTWLTLGSFTALALLYFGRRFFVRPAVAWLALNASLLLLGLSLTDPDFAKLVGKPDNVPIVAMFFLTGFFTWLSVHRAVQNDDRLVREEPPLEAIDDERVLVWPDLVYIELICMVALTALLIVWSLVLEAPLEAPASVVHTPNPSKAPWYFLGLQEMLKYFDPWMAGVVLPGLILFGLCAIPYLDPNKDGVGYCTIQQRKFAFVVYHFGFFGLWLLLIGIGTFIRGPNWEAFGVYETWDIHKSGALNQRDLSTFVWVDLLSRPRPAAMPGAGSLAALAYASFRELPGLLLLGLYFLVLPLAVTIRNRFFRDLYRQMGPARYVIMMGLLLVMLLVPIKMLAHWTLDLSYFVTFPEIRFSL